MADDDGMRGIVDPETGLPLPLDEALAGPFTPNPDGYPHLKHARHHHATTLQSLVGLPKCNDMTKRQSAYVSKTMNRSKEADTLLGRQSPVPWNGTRVRMEQRMQDLMAEVGVRRSLQTNIVDLSPRCNTNVLRFHRNQTSLEHLPMDGGWQYSTALSCMGNWVEERMDQAYAGSGFHTRELGLSKIYSTEHNEKFKPQDEQFMEKLLADHAVARFPKTKASRAPNGNESDSRRLYYSAGFGNSSSLDHTSPSKRGAYWLGTAPYTHETVATTSSKREQFEFQKRCRNYDPKAWVLASDRPQETTDASAKRATAKLQESQRHTAAWNTTYDADFKDRSRLSMTMPSAHRQTGELPGIHRPQSNV